MRDFQRAVRLKILQEEEEELLFVLDMKHNKKMVLVSAPIRGRWKCSDSLWVYAYLEISFGQFHTVIRIVLGSHQTKLVRVTIQNDFEIDKTQEETFASKHVTEQRSRHFDDSAFMAEHVSLFETVISDGCHSNRRISDVQLCGCVLVEHADRQLRLFCGRIIVQERLQEGTINKRSGRLGHLIFFQKHIDLFEQTVQEIVHNSSIERPVPAHFNFLTDQHPKL